MLALPVWEANQEVMTFWASPKCSASRETSFLKKRHESVDYRHENDILNFAIAFNISRKCHRSSNKWKEHADNSCMARSDVWRFCPSPLLP